MLNPPLLLCADEFQISGFVAESITSLIPFVSSPFYTTPAISAIRCFIHRTVITKSKQVIPIIRVYRDRGVANRTTVSSHRNIIRDACPGKPSVISLENACSVGNYIQFVMVFRMYHTPMHTSRRWFMFHRTEIGCITNTFFTVFWSVHDFGPGMVQYIGWNSTGYTGLHHLVVGCIHELVERISARHDTVSG